MQLVFFGRMPHNSGDSMRGRFSLTFFLCYFTFDVAEPQPVATTNEYFVLRAGIVW